MWERENSDVTRITNDVELVRLVKIKAACKELQKGPHKMWATASCNIRWNSMAITANCWTWGETAVATDMHRWALNELFHLRKKDLRVIVDNPMKISIPCLGARTREGKKLETTEGGDNHQIAAPNPQWTYTLHYTSSFAFASSSFTKIFSNSATKY